jgi:hypothetical protein
MRHLLEGSSHVIEVKIFDDRGRQVMDTYYIALPSDQAAYYAEIFFTMVQAKAIVFNVYRFAGFFKDLAQNTVNYPSDRVRVKSTSSALSSGIPWLRMLGSCSFHFFQIASHFCTFFFQFPSRLPRVFSFFLQFPLDCLVGCMIQGQYV